MNKNAKKYTEWALKSNRGEVEGEESNRGEVDTIILAESNQVEEPKRRSVAIDEEFDRITGKSIIEEELIIDYRKPDLVDFACNILGIPTPELQRGYFSHYAEAEPGIIRVNCPADKLAEVIFHECAHQWQYEHGLITPFYRGVAYEGSYWWAPWEIEARGIEGAIFHEWSKCTQKKRSKHLKRTLARLLMS
jgi:hypothetical protein